MTSLTEVDSAASLSEGKSLKEVQGHGEAAAAKEGVDQIGMGSAEEKAEGSENLGSSSTMMESEKASEESVEGKASVGEASDEEGEGSSNNAMPTEGEVAEKGEVATTAADETEKVNQDEQDTQRDDKSDSESSSTSDSDGQSSVPPFGEAIFAAAESLYDAYMELGFHLAQSSDEKTRKVLEAAMESVMKAARKMKVVEKVGEEMMRESEGKQEQPAESVKQPPAATTRSKPLVTQKMQPEGLSPSEQQDVSRLREPPQELLSIPLSLMPQRSPAADLAPDSSKVPAAATAASERSQSRGSQWSPQIQRKVAKVELSASYPVKKWDARNNPKDPGPKLYCVSSGDRGPAARGPGASPPKDLYDQASMLFNFAKHRSLLNASEEGKRVAFMMGLAHNSSQPRATMLRCVTAEKFKGKLEAREEGRKWSTQELREHRL